jgi:hypothetical protein
MIAAGILLVLASGLSVSWLMLLQGRKLHAQDQAYGIGLDRMHYWAAGIGLVVGLSMAGLLIFFLGESQRFNIVEWLGRFSYFLIIAATGGHLLVLVRTGLHLLKEKKGMKTPKAVRAGTLSHLRWQDLERLQRQRSDYLQFKGQDDERLEELVGVLAGPLLQARRNLSLIPFYGYLGTVCGILLMAFELGKIDEAAQTFKVLVSMANGLVLAFQTTLVALVAYLPLRKAADMQLQSLGRLEDAWLGWRRKEGK